MLNSVIAADARTLIQHFPGDCIKVDTIITSPPYWAQKDYGVPEQIGFGQTKEDYLNDLRKIFADLLTVTKDTGAMWLIVDDNWKQGQLQMLAWEVAHCAKESGWLLRDMIIWDKGHNLPYSGTHRMRHVSEFIFFFTKSEKYKFYVDRIKTLDGISKWWVDFPERFSPKGKTPTNIWSIPVRTQGSWRKPSKMTHHCPLPTELVSRILELSTDPGDLVIDPFAGSGVVLATAAAMDRNYIGIEINNAYIDMFHTVVKEQVRDEYKEIDQWNKKLDLNLEDFYRNIVKLRILKFTRLVSKSVLATSGLSIADMPYAVICSANLDKLMVDIRDQKITIDFIVGDSTKNYDELLLRAREHATIPPLTTYGINADVNVVSTQCFMAGMNGTSEHAYYLYPNYKTHAPVAERALRSWFTDIADLAASNGNKLPLLSNVHVNVDWVFEK